MKYSQLEFQEYNTFTRIRGTLFHPCNIHINDDANDMEILIKLGVAAVAFLPTAATPKSVSEKSLGIKPGKHQANHCDINHHFRCLA